MTPDRIQVSMGRKISITRFENLDLFVSYGKDKAPGQKPEQAIRETEELVLKEFNRLVELVETGKIEGAKAKNAI